MSVVEKPKNFKLPRTVVLIGIVSLMTDIAGDAIYPILPLFLSETLGSSALFIGAIEGAAESIASLTKFFSGYWSDRLGKREPFVIGGYALSAITRTCLSLVTAPWHAFGLRFLDRFGKGLRGAPRDAWLSSLATPSTRGWIFGFRQAMDNAGATLGPLLATLFLWKWPGDYRSLFLATAIPGAAAITFSIIASKKHEPHPTSTVKSSGSPPQNIFKALAVSSELRQYFLILALFTLGNSSDAFLLLRLRENGIAPALIPTLWAALNFVKMVSSIYGGRLSDRIGRKPSIVMGWMIYAAVYFSFAFVTRPFEIAAVFLVYGIYFGLTEAPEKALIADLCPLERQGSAFGLYNLVLGVGTLPASLLFGFLWHQLGPLTAFGFGAALALIASVLLLISVPSAKNVV